MIVYIHCIIIGNCSKQLINILSKNKQNLLIGLSKVAQTFANSFLKSFSVHPSCSKYKKVDKIRRVCLQENQIFNRITQITYISFWRK